MIAKKNIQKVYLIFLFSHLFIWTLIPSLTNVNLPLDTIEALAWASKLEWGFNKHPPFSAFAVEFFFQLFGNRDWAYYLLSQIFVVTSLIFIFKLAKEFLNNDFLALISILLLEGIYFFNYTSPEFNVNVSQLPFWALCIYFTWRCMKKDRVRDYLFLGVFMGLGFLSKYLFLYLILGIKFLFIYLFINKKIKSYNFLLVGPIALLVIFPHLIWLFENNFVTLKYGIQRSGSEGEMINHLIYPLTFILKQIVILIPFLIMSLLLLKRMKPTKIQFNEKIIFLFFIFVVPIFLIILTSFIMGAKIRTMWMTPFYLMAGITFIQIFKKNINVKSTKKFYFSFLFLFIFSPSAYTFVSLSNDFKRTDYPGKEIARLVQNRWDDNFNNEIKLVIGDEWYAGNLSYHLESRPQWVIELKAYSDKLNLKDGVIYTGNPKVLKNICPGVFGTIKPVGYCMIGTR